MKIQKLLARLGLAAVLLVTLNSQLSTAHAQGTAFTYQGRLDIAGTPANGTNDLTFTLFDAAAAGATVGTSNTVNDLVITNGLFTVTLDFGASAFNGAARWLQIAARPGVSTGAYTNLAPRQAITPSPYAVFAGGAAASGVTGTLPAGALSGAYSGSVNLSNAANSFAGNGSGLTALNASNLTSGTVADARLSTNVAFLNGTNVFSGSNRFAGVFIATNAGSQFGGSGAGLSNLNAGNLTGTLSAGALSGAYSGSVNLSNAANSFAGNGAGLTALNASNLASGTVADARLSANVALRSGGNTFNGTQVITNGNVGIGTTTPSAQLDVRGPSTLVGGIALGDYNITNSRYIGIIAPGQPANIGAGSGFSGVEFGGPAGNANSGLLAFHTHNFGGGSSERMRIDKSGKVGIGTTKPSALLSLDNSLANTKLALFEDGISFYGLGVQNQQFRFHLASASGRFSFLNSPNGTENLTISGTGKVGIGTNNPAQALHVMGQGVFASSSVGSDPGNGLGPAVVVGYNSIYDYGYVQALHSGVAPKPLILQPDAGSGNVGIGTGIPNAKLDVNGSINVAAAATIGSSGRLHIQSQAGEPLYLNPFVGGTDVIIGGGGASPNLVLSGGEIYASAINLTSDRNAKEQFKPVSPREVLSKVAALPITEWQYKTQGDARHIGPMAQDFHAAFGTGRDDKHITSVDADGVALAAIQGLNEKLEEKSAEVDALKQSVAELRELVKRLAQPAGR